MLIYFLLYHKFDYSKINEIIFSLKKAYKPKILFNIDSLILANIIISLIIDLIIFLLRD